MQHLLKGVSSVVGIVTGIAVATANRAQFETATRNASVTGTANGAQSRTAKPILVKQH